MGLIKCKQCNSLFKKKHNNQSYCSKTCKKKSRLRQKKRYYVDYYKSIRKSWNKFLDKFAVMSLEERVEAFTVFSGAEKALEILDNSSGDKLEYIHNKTEPKLEALETKASELESKSKVYLVSHLGYTLDSAKMIEKKSDEYWGSVIRAEIEYNIMSHLDSSEKKVSNLVFSEVDSYSSIQKNNNVVESSLSKEEVLVVDSTVDDLMGAVKDIIVGTVTLVFGAVMLGSAIVTSGFTAGISSKIAPAAIGLIIKGLTNILNGIQKLINTLNQITK